MPQNIAAPGLEEYVVKGIEDKITKYFGVTKTYFVTSSDRMSRMKVLAQNKDIKFPIAFLTFATGALDTTYNPRSLRRQGTLTDLSTDGTKVGRVYTVPTLMSFNVVMMTDEFTHVLKFFKLWMLAASASSLSFDITYDNAPISIGVILSPSLSIPTKETSLETPSYFEFEGTLDVHGYVSPDYIEQVPLVMNGAVITAQTTPQPVP